MHAKGVALRLPVTLPAPSPHTQWHCPVVSPASPHFLEAPSCNIAEGTEDVKDELLP